MPLDASDLENASALAVQGDDLARLRPVRVVLNPDVSLGEALREARLSLGLEIEDIAQATRVRSGYIANLEAFEIDALPARPFAIGYLRAYARALGVEPDAVVARFLEEAPEIDDTLRAPAGLRRAPRRLGLIGAAALLIVAIVVGWNIARHARTEPAHRAVAPGAAVTSDPVEGPARLGAPLPPPPEATSPPAYTTPGLGGSLDDGPAPVIGSRFVAAGAVYGAPAVFPATDVMLQARRTTSLIVRGPAGAVLFARELSPGEAWRAPTAGWGLTVDVASPSAIEVFQGGVSRGALAAAQTPVARLAS